MNVDVINAFLTEGMNAFNTMFGIEANPNKPDLLDTGALGHQWEISGLLGLTGQYKGVVAFRLHKLLANKMLELSGIECSEEERNDVAIGLVSEFTNVISGHAVTSLKDYFLDISPPYTIIGQNHVIAWPKNYPVIAIPFTTSYGPFEVDVCFK
ncbi:MAG: chemotaxis protein CheX [Treponema sp.]|nr:chemotaxis protein CheX [Treponema sp.]